MAKRCSELHSATMSSRTKAQKQARLRRAREEYGSDKRGLNYLTEIAGETAHRMAETARLIKALEAERG